MNSELISIIVPVYKSESLLSKCIESVLEQTYQNFELILVDDGSPDASGTICDYYKNKDVRVLVIHKENGGASDARNVGLKIANGEYICFLDSDDYLEKNFLSEAIGKIGSADYYVSGLKMFGKGDDAKFVSSASGYFSIKDLFEMVFYKIPQIYLCGPCCKLFKKDIIVKHKIQFDPTIRCGEDTDFNLNYLRNAKLAYVDEGIYYNYYRGNSNSLFSSYNKQYYDDHVRVYDKWLALICDLGCSESAICEMKKRYIGMLISNIDSSFVHNVGKSEIKRIIKKLSNDKMICSKVVPSSHKIRVIKFLLKHHMTAIVFFVYRLHYRGYRNA